MELWNNNDEFRKDYVQHNIMSTLRRLKTLDGRSLGPDEKPPVLRNLIEERTDAAHLASTKRTTSLVSSAPEMKQEKAIAPVSLEESVAKVELGQNNLSSKSTKTAKQTSTETVPVTISSRVEVVEETEKESKQTKEEQEKAKKAEELARKEEELRKEEAAAKLKEQRRLEEKAKAEAAEERKKRNAEKAHARAELRAKREAELKEKVTHSIFYLNSGNVFVRQFSMAFYIHGSIFQGNENSTSFSVVSVSSLGIPKYFFVPEKATYLENDLTTENVDMEQQEIILP